jgi:hypothetical protein
LTPDVEDWAAAAGGGAGRFGSVAIAGGFFAPVDGVATARFIGGTFYGDGLPGQEKNQVLWFGARTL